MTQIEINKNNALIAEFMGITIHPGNVEFVMFMDYHQSWDWLMPVIKTIREQVNADMGFAEYDDWRENFKQIDPYNYSIIQCYEAVIQFIKWYNDKDN